MISIPLHSISKAVGLADPVLAIRLPLLDCLNPYWPLLPTRDRGRCFWPRILMALGTVFPGMQRA